MLVTSTCSIARNFISLKYDSNYFHKFKRNTINLWENYFAEKNK
jgi:hypothetical protein